MEATDIAAIVNVINLYPVAVDTQQWHLFGQGLSPRTFMPISAARPYGTGWNRCSRLST